MKTTKQFFAKGILVIVLIIAVIVAAFFWYNQELRKSLAETNCETLLEVLEQQRFNLYQELTADMATLENLALLLKDLPEEDENTVTVLQNLCNNSHFAYLFFADLEGDVISSTNNLGINIADIAYFQHAKEGKTVIDVPILSRVTNTKVTPIATPVYNQAGEITGVLAGAYTMDNLKSLILPSFGGEGMTFVVDRNGQIIVASASLDALFGEADSFWDGLQQVPEFTLSSVEETAAHIEQRQAGHLSFEIDRQTRYVHYQPLGINDWYIFAAVDYQVIARSASSIFGSALILTFVVGGAFLLLGMFIYRQQKRATRDLKRVAYYDEFTGLPNFTKFKLDACKVLEENKDQSFLVTMVDLRALGFVNEMYGMKMGDQVIEGLSKALQVLLRCDLDLIARVHADTFILLMKHDHRDRTSRHNIAAFRHQFEKYVPLHMTVCVGRYFIPVGETDIDSIFEKVNYAHHMAKREGSTENICDYDEKIKLIEIHNREIEAKMEDALKNEDFKLYLQPKYQVNNERLVGAEALVRWHDNVTGKIISPAEFIPLFEQNGFITRLDCYMFEQVCKLLHDWKKQGKELIPISVNFSRRHIENPNFIVGLIEIAEKYHIAPKYLELEMTESVIATDVEAFEDILSKLHLYGFSLSMDDFGTGYSSLGLLMNLEVDVIKIDRSFFVESKHQHRSKNLLKNVIHLAHDLKIQTVAEGVETKEQLHLLREIGCEVVQGFYYAAPLSISDFEKHRTCD